MTIVDMTNPETRAVIMQNLDNCRWDNPKRLRGWLHYVEQCFDIRIGGTEDPRTRKAFFIVSHPKPVIGKKGFGGIPRDMWSMAIAYPRKRYEGNYPNRNNPTIWQIEELLFGNETMKSILRELTWNDWRGQLVRLEREPSPTKKHEEVELDYRMVLPEHLGLVAEVAGWGQDKLPVREILKVLSKKEQQASLHDASKALGVSHQSLKREFPR